MIDHTGQLLQDVLDNEHLVLTPELSDRIRAAISGAEIPQAKTEVSAGSQVISICPHCSANNVFVRRPWLDARHRVECRICRMVGPEMTTPLAAIATWNSLPRAREVI